MTGTSIARSRVRAAAVFAAALLLALGALPGTALAKPVRIKLATIAPQGTSWHTLLSEMAERWQEASDGQVRVRIYAGGVLGGELDVLAKMRIGQVQAATLTATGLRDISASEVQTLQTPGLIHNNAELDEVWKVMGPELEKTLYENDFQVVHWGEAGWGHFFTESPLKNPKETGGFKIFSVAGDPGVAATFKGLGFTPVVISATEMIPSLKTGMINATLAPPYAALSLRWFEEANNMTDFPMLPFVGGTVVTRKAWEQIPAELQPKLLEISREIGERARGDVRKAYEESIAAMQTKGLTIVETTEADREAWLEAQRKTWDLAKENGAVPVKTFDATQKALEAFRAAQ